MGKTEKLLLASTVVASSLFGDPLNTHTELSYMTSSGNSNTDTLSLKSELSKKFDETKGVKGKITALYVTDDNGDAIANRHYLEGEYNHKVSKNFFGYLKANYTKDKFSGFDYRYNVGPGLGYHVPIENKDHSLDLSLGAMYSEDSIENGSSEDYQSGEVALKYAWKIQDGLKFKQDLSYRTDLDETDNYFADSTTALEYKITDMLSLGTSYTVNYQNESPTDKNTDRIFLTSLIIDY